MVVYVYFDLGVLAGILLGMITVLVAAAGAITLIEKMPFSDTLYFAFVTGLTIGYGDIVMKTPGARIIALTIALVGILFTGLMVAVLVYTVRKCLEESRKHG